MFPASSRLTVELTRMLFPFILFVSLAAAVMGMLNARFVFGVPASASTVFNIVSVVAGVSLAYAFDPAARAHWPIPCSPIRRSMGSASGCCSAAWRSWRCSCLHCIGLGSASTGAWTCATRAWPGCGR